ncbi:hypothetical protein BH09ACT9_BH09ACT9_00440 [soil metagenome]
MSDEFTPTTEQVRSGYAIDPEAEYHDPLTNHTALGERAFDRWLLDHDRRIKAEALNDIANDIQGSASVLWYGRSRIPREELSEMLNRRSAELRLPPV